MRHTYLVSAGALLALLGLAGCVTPGGQPYDNPCVVGNWQEVGYRDALAGYSADRYGYWREYCGAQGAIPDPDGYRMGWQRGVNNQGGGGSGWGGNPGGGTAGPWPNPPRDSGSPGPWPNPR